MLFSISLILHNFFYIFIQLFVPSDEPNHTVDDCGVRVQTTVPALFRTFRYGNILCPAFVFGVVSAVTEVLAQSSCKDIFDALFAVFVNELHFKSALQVHTVIVLGDCFIYRVSALFGQPARGLILLKLVVFQSILRCFEIDGHFRLSAHNSRMIAFTIVTDKLCRIAHIIYARILLAQIIHIQLIQNTSMFLVKRSVMFGLKISFVLDYIFEFCKNMNFVVLIENIFGRMGKHVCFIRFKLGID